MKYFQYLLLLFGIVALTACGDDDAGLSPEEQLQTDIEII